MTEIGFVGLGRMGGAMSRHLLKAGHALRVHDLNSDAVQALVALGAKAAPDGRLVADGAEVVFTMLPRGADVEAAVFGPNGVVEGLAPGALLIDMSTILPDETRAICARLAERGVAMIDAPAGRTSAHAEAGTSTFMVGGTPTDLERARPLLELLGESITHCGPLGAGATVKLVNNYISAVINLATAEGVNLGLAAGVKLETIVEVISQTPAGQGHIKTTWPQKALKDDPEPAFMLDLATKDLGLALQAGSIHRATLATGAAAHQVYAQAQSAGHGHEDWTTGIFRTVQGLSATTDGHRGGDG
ncbi:MAG: NAD(P)-binding domain-containing protein [Pseudomonadota bacterium]